MPPQVLSQRALNRATLARQMLLERATVRPITAIERLAGMQAQAPLAPYVGLWTRLDGFQAEDLADLMRRRRVVRASLMRVTIHLVSARDALAWRPIIQRVAEGGWRGSQWSKQIADADPADVVAAAYELLDGQAIGRTEIGKQLAQTLAGCRPVRPRRHRALPRGDGAADAPRGLGRGRRHDPDHHALLAGRGATAA